MRGTARATRSTLAALLMIFLAPSTATHTRLHAMTHENISRLLADSRTEANHIRDDAALLESLSWSDATTSSRASVLNQIRGHLNSLGRQLTRLRAVRGNAQPWQQLAIDRIAPLITDLAAETEMVIEHLNGATPLLNFRDYRELLEAHADSSGELAKLISDFVDYGRVKQRLDHLNNKLELEDRPAGR